MKKRRQQCCKPFLTRNSKLLITFLFLFLTCILKAQTVTITTDQDDYYPGEWVIINGSDWIPGDSVKLSITHIGDSIPNHTHAPWTLVVDANGNLFDEWYVAEMELNTTLWLQAQSLSSFSMYAEKVFTDAINWTLNLQSNRQSASNYCATTTNNVIQSFIISVSNPSGLQHSLDLAGIKVTIGGTWTANDVMNFKLYFTDKSNTFVTNELLTIIQNPIPGIQYFTFNTPSTFTTTGNYYFWITADISAEAFNGHTIIGNSLTKSSITSSSSLGNGTALVSSAKKIVASPIGTLNVTENSGIANDNIIHIGDNITVVATEGFASYDFKVNDSSVQSGPANTFNCSSLINDASITVEVTNSSGCSSIFGPVLIKVNETPIIANQPLNQFIDYGMNANFTVTHNSNEPFTYNWQIKTDTAEVYTDISDGEVYSNSNTSTLTLTRPTVAMTGNQYRCIVSNTYGSTMSEAALLTVNARRIIITADAKSKTYGNDDPVLTAQVTSGTIVGSDTATGSLSRAAGENVGSYAINKGTYTYGTNYNETFVGDNLVIGQRPVTITPDAGLAKVYGTPDPVFTYSSSEALISGHTFSGALNRTAGENVADGPFTYSLGTLSAGPNYALTLGGNSTFAITKAPSVTTVTAGNATYNAHPHGGTATVTGAGGLSQSLPVTYSGSGTLVYGPTSSAPVNASSYNAAANYPGDANHEPSADNKDFTIALAQATIAVVGYAGIYDASPHGASLTAVSGAPEDDLRSFVVLGDSFTNVPGGTAHWSFSNPNYISQSGDVAVSISKAPSVTEVTITGAPFTYTGSAITPATVSVTGAGDLNLAPAPLYANNINAGTATASYSYAGDANHEASSDSKTFVIGKANAIISVIPYSVTYDGLAHKASFTAVGVEPTPADLSTFVDISATEHKNAGMYPNDAWSFAGNENYNFVGGTINNVVGQRPITITADGRSKTYGDTDPALTAQVTSGTIVGSDAVSGSLARAEGENVGSYAISKASYTYGSNYNETFVGDNLVIGQRPITITVTANQFKYCGQLDPLPFTYDISGMGLATGDECAGALQRTAGECSNFYPINIGSHTIVCGNIDKKSNYKITFIPDNFEVKGVSVDASGSSTPVQTGNPMVLKAQISPAVADVSVVFNVEDGNGKITSYPSVKTGSTGLATLSATGLTSVDVYKVTASIGICTSSTAAYLAVYDPSGGFVTGGGWINSPPNAYKTNLDLTGKANFGFNSKYQKGKNIPDGNTEFQFQAGNLNFSSSTYSLGSLVISGAKATYKGVGTINGSGNYAFMVSVIDGNVTGGGGYDKFRIKIWNANDVIYDNNMGMDENDIPITSLGGGSIVIHNDKTKSAEIPQNEPAGEQDVVSCNIVIPNGFSPNGDGLNDYFRISCLQDHPNAALKIYTPAGRLVFEQQHYGNFNFWGSEDAAWWNGCIGSNTSGSALPSGSYLYILELNPLRKEAVKTGFVFINK